MSLSTEHATGETDREREREFVKAQSESLTSLFQIPEVFSALEGLELIWLSGFPLLFFATNYSRIPAIKLINSAELGKVSEETPGPPYWLRAPPLRHLSDFVLLFAVVNTLKIKST